MKLINQSLDSARNYDTEHEMQEIEKNFRIESKSNTKTRNTQNLAGKDIFVKTSPPVQMAK